jgi:SMC interacting uncharacterized protein involved in chromosome segregation
LAEVNLVRLLDFIAGESTTCCMGILDSVIIKLLCHNIFQIFAELNHITDNSLLDQKVKEYNKDVTELWDKLMGLELQLVDQFEVCLKCEKKLYYDINAILCQIYVAQNSFYTSFLGHFAQ